MPLPSSGCVGRAHFCVPCLDPRDFISAKDLQVALKRLHEQNQKQRWSEGRLADKCAFPHPYLIEKEGHRFWGVSSNLGSCSNLGETGVVIL